jgi:hypothetical protein
MITLYFRSSSLGQWDYCSMSYFITYQLGWQQPAQKKAQLGTVVHKVLECLAQCKQRLQYGEKPGMRIEDGELGTIKFTKNSLYTNKFVVNLLNQSYEYYTTSDKINQYDSVADYNFCREMVDACLNYNDGQFDPRKTRIVAPEKSFDLEIDEPWATFDYKGKPTKLRIKGTMDLITESDPDTLEYVDYKGLPIETKLLTPSGWTTMGDVQVGDTLYDKDGNSTRVIGKSQVKHKECFKIIFDDTSEAECDDEHIWLLSNSKEVQIKDLKINDKIDVSKPVKYEHKSLPIDPYVLGIWLGDGRNRSGEVCGKDSFIFDEIKRRGYILGKDISCKDCPSHTIFGLTKELKKLNLIHNKHIPDIYLKSSYEQRLDLVRGLMDSDGYANKIRKQGHFVNCNETLSKNLKELLLSLGQRPYLKKLKKRGFGLEVFSYDVFFRPINLNPFLLPRKADVIDKNWGPGESNRRQIKQIIPIGKKYTQCIMVDSPSHTYLCTENMIPTHNTGRRINWATGEEKTYDKLYDDIQLLLYYYAIRRLYPQYSYVIMTIFFLRDGGPFSLCYEKKDEEKFLEKLKAKFLEIKNNSMPKPINPARSDFRCTRLCHYYKNKWPGTDQRICNYVEDQIKLYGIDNAIKSCSKPGFSLDYYSAPGTAQNQ